MLPLQLLAFLPFGLAPDGQISTSTPPPAPIINGTYDPGDLAVVGLHDSQGGEPFCTGTLVSRHVVVSAGHCVEFGGPTFIYFGSDSSQGGAFIPVRSYQSHPMFDYNSLANDISVVILDAPAPPDVIPLPMASTPPVVGDTARFVGFGYTQVGPAGEYGRKFQMTGDVTQVDGTSFGYGVATCNGDSGGPAFLTVAGTEFLAGVTSWGDGPCAEFGWDTRVDVYRDWIDPIVALEDPPTCDADGQCAGGCTLAPDPDCPCATDGHCTQACMMAGADADCPAECAADGTCYQDCPYRDVDCPIIDVGGACGSDFDCGENFCQDVCRPLCPTGTCPDGLTCSPVAGERMACLDEGGGGCGVASSHVPGRPGGRGFGALAWLLPAAVIGLLVGRKRARP